MLDEIDPDSESEPDLGWPTDPEFYPQVSAEGQPTSTGGADSRAPRKALTARLPADEYGYSQPGSASGQTDSV